jgi:hypothetical protein
MIADLTLLEADIDSLQVIVDQLTSAYRENRGLTGPHAFHAIATTRNASSSWVLRGRRYLFG